MRRLLLCGVFVLAACGSDGGSATLSGVPDPVQSARSQRDFQLYLDGGNAPETSVELYAGSPDETCAQLKDGPSPIEIIMGQSGSSTDSALPASLEVIPGEDPHLPDGGPAALVWYYDPGSGQLLSAVSGQVKLDDTSPTEPKGSFDVQIAEDAGTVTVTGSFDAPTCVLPR